VTGRHKFVAALVCAATVLVWSGARTAAQTSPFRQKIVVWADVVSVYDGDTFTALARPWPGMSIRISVRVNGIDTPEIKGKCEFEKERARAAREFTKSFIGDKVLLVDVRLGKYAGRILADVFSSKGNLAQALIDEGLARAYAGGPRKGWCSPQVD